MKKLILGLCLALMFSTVSFGRGSFGGGRSSFGGGRSSSFSSGRSSSFGSSSHSSSSSSSSHSSSSSSSSGSRGSWFSSSSKGSFGNKGSTSKGGWFGSGTSTSRGTTFSKPAPKTAQTVIYESHAVVQTRVYTPAQITVYHYYYPSTFYGSGYNWYNWYYWYHVFGNHRYCYHHGGGREIHRVCSKDADCTSGEMCDMQIKECKLKPGSW
jgi:hypothetical protein